MLSIIPDILNGAELREVGKIIAKGTFVDGKDTAGFRAKRVKNNAQLKKQSEDEKTLNKMLREKLLESARFKSVAFPKRIAIPLISRYTPGMEYGFHMDDAIMDKTNPLRTDISVTIFLNNPTDYQGGELVIESPYGRQEIKLPMGTAIVYPSTTLHRVAPVTKGERLVAVTWVQSRIRDPQQRDLLVDLEAVRKKLSKLEPDAPETDLAFKSYGNLMRMWSDI
jgi:PKHD-type hydroxylase